MKPASRYPTGIVVWAIPGSVFEIMWLGPGAGLFFGQPRKPNGMNTRIRHHTADGQYMTEKEAATAVQAFIDAAKEDE